MAPSSADAAELRQQKIFFHTLILHMIPVLSSCVACIPSIEIRAGDTPVGGSVHTTFDHNQVGLKELLVVKIL